MLIQEIWNMHSTLRRSLLLGSLSLILLTGTVLSQTTYWHHFEGTANLPVGPILFHPSGTIFIGLVNGGGGLLASTDDGITWTTLAPGPQVRSLVRTSSGAMLWGTYGDAGGVPVYRSTDDGTSWTASSTGITDTSVMMLAVSPTGVILAGGLEQGIFRSTDDGVTWTATGGQQDWFTRIRYAPDGVVYACAYGSRKVFRSADDGVTWSQINTTYIDSTYTAPFDLLPLGNSVLYVATYGEGFYKTTNDGTSWTRSLNGEEMQVSPNRFRTIVRDSMGVLYVGTDEAGAFMSTDDGTTWTDISDGFNSIVVNNIVMGPSSRLYAALETRGEGGGLYRSAFTANPLLTPVQATVSLGTVVPGGESNGVIELANTSLGSIDVQGWSLVSLDTSFAPEPTSAVSVPARDTLRIAVTFRPAAAGSYRDTLIVSSSAANAPIRIVVEGTGAILPPDAPVLVTPASGADSVLLPVVFRWHAAAGAATYAIDVATDQTFTTIVASQSSLTDTTVSMDAFAFSTEYAWRVTAMNAVGGTSSSSFTFRTAPAPPPPPMLISPMNDSTNVFQPFWVHWQPVDGASGYRVLVAEDSLLQNIVHDEQTAVTDSAAVWGLDPNARYYWTVLSGNAGGWGDTLEIRTLVTSLPAPVGLNPTNGGTIPSNMFTASWEPVDGAIAYEVFVGGALGWPVVAWEKDLKQTSLTVGPLFDNYVYGWWVRAIGPYGPGPWYYPKNGETQFMIPQVEAPELQAVSVRPDWDATPMARTIGLFDSNIVFLSQDSTYLFDGTTWTSYPPVYNGGPRRPVQYGDDLYTGMYEGASVWKFRYGNWAPAFSPPEQRAGMRNPMAVSQGYLWYGTHWNGKLYRWNGSSYTVFSTGSMEVCPVIEYDSTAYAFTNKSGEGKMFRYNPVTDALDQVMVLSPYYHTLDAAVYKGNLYMSNYLYPHGVVEVYDGTSKWEVWDPGNNMWPMYYALTGDSLFVTVWNDTESRSEIWLTTDGAAFAKIYTHSGTGGTHQIHFIQAYKGMIYFATSQNTYRLNLNAGPITPSGSRILTPNGGEVFHAGDSVEVKFIADYTGSYIAAWSTDLYEPWNAFDTVAVTAGDTASCWFVPTWPSLGWKIRVSYASNLTLTDESDAGFTVTPLPPNLVSPADNSVNQLLSVRFEWEMVDLSTYAIELALDSLFSQIVVRDTVIHGVTDSGFCFYTVSDLQRNTRYYWRVLSRILHVDGRWGPVRMFRTLGTVEVSSPGIVFDDVAVGDSAFVTLAVRNASQSGSRRLHFATSSGRFPISPAGEVDCPPGDSVMVAVMFQPVEYGEVRDSLIVTSLSDVVYVPIEGVSNDPGISVVAPYVAFDQVQRGDSATALFRVTGASVNPFFLDTMRTTTSLFEVTYMPGPLTKGDTIDVNVVFRPVGYGSFTDTLKGVLGVYEGPLGLLFGRCPWSYLAIEPQTGQFDAIPVGSMDTIDLVLRDTTVNRAHVDSITFSLPVYSATYIPSTGDADSSLCRVVFSPAAAGSYADTMYIWADVEQGYLAIPVSGIGISVSGVALEDLGIPKEFTVAQNYPNPFNPSTTIRFGLPEESTVRAVVVDMTGRQIAVVADGIHRAGWHEDVWHANVASGVYFLRVEAVPIEKPADRKIRTMKMLLLR